MENSIEQLVFRVCSEAGKAPVPIRTVPFLSGIAYRLSHSHDISKPWLLAIDDDTLLFVDWSKAKVSDVLGGTLVRKIGTHEPPAHTLVLKAIIELLLSDEKPVAGYISTFFWGFVTPEEQEKLTKRVSIISRCAVIAIYLLYENHPITSVCGMAQGGLKGYRQGEIETDCFLCQAIVDTLCGPNLGAPIADLLPTAVPTT